MRKWAMIVAAAAGATMATASTEIPMTPEYTRIHLSGIAAEDWELWRERNSGWNQTLQYRWWTFEEGGHTGEVAFWYSPEDAGGRSGDRDGHTSFLTHFTWLKDRDAGTSGLSEGPTVSTVVGDIGTTMFDVDTRTRGEDLRECIGFRHWWDRFRNGYRSNLDFYACGLDGKRMTEEQFVDILRGLGVEGEFDALVTD